MSAALTSFRATLALLLAIRVLGALGGLLLNTIWQHQSALAAARTMPSMTDLLANNLRGTALVGTLSGVTGGVAGALFTLVDGLRYGIAISGGTVAAPARGLTGQLSVVAFPWLEFLAVSLAAAGASVLFWRTWFGLKPVVRVKHALAVVALIAACLLVAAELEAWLLA